MPNASAQGVKKYIRLKGRRKARDFQKINAEEWLNDNLEYVPLSDNG